VFDRFDKIILQQNISFEGLFHFLNLKIGMYKKYVFLIVDFCI